ncbi:hypothetical protein Tco_1155651 [Tanacetum coccineum]
MGTVAEYQNEFEMLINRVTRISESLLKSFYISGLKPALQCALLRSNLTTLGEAFSLARATEARFTRSSSFSNKTSSNNSGLQNQNLTTSRFTMPCQEPVDEVVFVKVNDETKGFSVAESIEENNAFDVTSSDQPAAGLEANKVVNDGDDEWMVNKDDANVVKVVGVADEQISDEPNVLEGNGVIGVGYIKKKKMKAAIQRRLWDPEIKIFFRQHLEGKVVSKEQGMLRMGPSPLQNRDPREPHPSPKCQKVNVHRVVKSKLKVKGQKSL